MTNLVGPSHPWLPGVFLIWRHSAPETIQRRIHGSRLRLPLFLFSSTPATVPSGTPAESQVPESLKKMLKWMCAMSPQKHPRSNRLHHLGASQPFFKHQLPTLVQVRPHLHGPHSLSHCYQVPSVSPRQSRRQQSPCDPCSCSGISLAT